MNIRLSLWLLIALVAVSACGKNDATDDYGFPLVYIPQATVTGLDNSYPIPNGPVGQNSTYSCRYDESAGVLEIALGVIRSGYLHNAKGFSVSLKTSSSVCGDKLADYESKSVPAALLPLEYCTVPQTITVEPGKNGATCYVGVDLEGLSELSLYESGAYKILLLGLEISDPTEYELAEENTSVVIVLDLNSAYWDDVAENLPESAIRDLFPIY